MKKPKSIDEILSGWSSYNRPANGAHFRHYKGGEYQIVETGFLENNGKPAVIYKSLDKDIVWIRAAENFFEKIIDDGTKRSRFEKC